MAETMQKVSSKRNVTRTIQAAKGSLHAKCDSARLCFNRQVLVSDGINLLKVHGRLPRPNRCALVRQSEASVKGLLDNGRCLLELLLRVLFVYSQVVLVWLLATLNHHCYHGLELAPGVARVVDVVLCLDGS